MNLKKQSATKDKLKENSNIVTLLKGSIIAIIITMIGLFILSLVLTYTSVSEEVSTPVIMAIMGISILIGSIISSRKVSKNGMINGGLVGIIYILSIFLLSSICGSGFGMNMYTILTMIIAVVAGIIGGIIGINIK